MRALLKGFGQGLTRNALPDGCADAFKEELQELGYF